MSAKDVIGREGKRAAAGYLEGSRFRILDRDWRSADGEIDLIAVERHKFLVCQAKTRQGTQLAALGARVLWLGLAR